MSDAPQMSLMLGYAQTIQRMRIDVSDAPQMHALVDIVSQTRKKCMQWGKAQARGSDACKGKSSPAILPAYGKLRDMSRMRTLVVWDAVC